ncbi:MAG: MBL fold metallo-hydrolase [Desulfobacteraceae bacterium]|nr:MBL fold metallo-hydrolase [Desulfobacteraceae bacterium]MCF8094348.1 MBL fold metallo-hydrolase [Desulfobacteraceae bacterium]
MTVSVQAVDRVEILTLQDNYIDILAGDDSNIITRARSRKEIDIQDSIIAEHGFSAMITTFLDDRPRTILFDFGFSEHGAAFNARNLGADMSRVEIMALSHGHMDHVGGIEKLSGMIGKPGIELIVHPEVFRAPRYHKVSENLKYVLPPFTRQKAKEAAVTLVETAEPYPMAERQALFLSEIERVTGFEKGAPSLWYEKDGVPMQDTFEDDTSLVFLVKNKGLVILSGCAHSGIVNTVQYARKVTGIDQVYAVMGGFHLSGPGLEPVIQPTIDALKEIDPAYIIPAHCTGRNAAGRIEAAFADRFILNMSGTKLSFASDQ